MESKNNLFSTFLNLLSTFFQSLVAPAVESSIAVEDAVENRGLYRVFVSRLF